MFIHIRTLLFFYHCLPRKIPSLRFSSNITIIFSLRLNSLFYTRNRGMDFRTSLIHSLVLYPWVSGLNSLSLSLFVCEVGIITPASLWAILKLNSWTRPFRTNTQKRCPFHYRGLECKSRKSKNNWSNRQLWVWNTEWSMAKTNRVLPRKCTGHSKRPLPITQEKTLHMGITRWSTLKSHWLYFLQPKMEKRYTVSKNKTGNWLWLRSWTPYCQIQT